MLGKGGDSLREYIRVQKRLSFSVVLCAMTSERDERGSERMQRDEGGGGEER